MLWLTLRLILIVAAMLVALSAYAHIPVPRGSSFKWLMSLTVLALLMELGGFLLAAMLIHNTLPYTVFVVVEYIILLMVFVLMKPGWRVKISVVGSLGLLFYLCVVTGSVGEPFIATEGLAVLAAVVSGVSLCALWDLAQESTVLITRVPAFWIHLGLLTYFGGMLPVLAGIRLLYGMDRELALSLWSILPLLCVVRYLLTAMAFRRAVPERTTA